MPATSSMLMPKNPASRFEEYSLSGRCPRNIREMSEMSRPVPSAICLHVYVRGPTLISEGTPLAMFDYPAELPPVNTGGLGYRAWGQLSEPSHW